MGMKRFLILDTETTGLDPAVDRVVEVAAILYSVEHATTERAFSSLIRGDSNAAESINRIPVAALAGAWMAEPVWSTVFDMAEYADAIVAHRAEFDRGFAPPPLKGAPWICSKFDLEWPRGKPGASLVQLALDHDLGVAYAHRAMADCDLLARLFTRARELGANLPAMLERGLRPKTNVIALVSYDDRELAKKAGFQWDAGSRQWHRRMVLEDAIALPFKVREVSA
jgi:DNA polymerase-3 subunit epsilon